ncbi:MAG: hypothetical protein J5647_12305 [Spirochaetaceae bacterium]|nr:hypothetical protein [Spirochaetaceae bacterium]
MTKIFGKAFFVLLICVLFGSFFSCSNGEEIYDYGNGNGGSSELKYLAISNAKSLYIKSNSSANYSARSASDSNKLFKITDTGYVEEVSYLDEDGDEISIEKTPVAVNSVNDDYIFVGFGWNSSIDNSYLVRKSDGAVFSLDNAGIPNGERNYINEQFIKTDNDNNIYYTSSGKIIKISLNDSDFLSAITISPSTDDVYKFDIDRDGNVIYIGWLRTGNGNQLTRLKKVNGGLANLDDIFDDCWIGLDGNIYYPGQDVRWDEQDDCYYYYGSCIKRISVDSSYNLIDEIYGYPENQIYLYRGSTYKIDMTDRIVFIHDSTIYELYNDPGIPRRVTLTSLDIRTVTAVASSENYYYIAGYATNNDTFLIKIDPTDDFYTDLLPRNDYDVYAFTASEMDGIVFNALRMNDGKKVLGKVGINGGDVTMLDEESNAEVICLERIN